MDNDPNTWLLQEFISMDSSGQRTFLANLVKSLPASQVKYLADLCHRHRPSDPFQHLPPHICRRILHSCQPETVVRIGRASKRWREISLQDSGLWKGMSIKHPLSRVARKCGQGNLIKCFQAERRLRLNWQQNKARMYSIMCHGNSAITCLQIDETNGRFYTGSEDNHVKVWQINPATGSLERVAKLSGHRGGVWAMKAAGDVLISGSTDRCLIVWDLKTMTIMHRLIGHISTIRCLEIWKEFCISGSRDGTLKIWNWQTGELVHRIHAAHTSSVRCMALFGKGAIVSGSYDNSCALWDIQTGRLIARFTGHWDKVYSVACHGRYIFSGSMDGSVRVWRYGRDDAVRVLAGPRTLVGNLKVANGKLAAACTDGSLRLWDISRLILLDDVNAIESLIYHPQAHPNSITTIDMNRWAVITGSESVCRLWDLSGYAGAHSMLLDSANGEMIWRVALSESFAAVAYQEAGRTKLNIYNYSP